MQDKKYILKRTVSFITSVCILSCYYSVPLSAAAANTTTAVSETEQTTTTTQQEHTYTLYIGNNEVTDKTQADILYASLLSKGFISDENGKMSTKLTPDELKKLINTNIFDCNDCHYKFAQIKDYCIKLDQYYIYTVHTGGKEITSKTEADKFYGSLFKENMNPDTNGKITTAIAPQELENKINKDNLIQYNDHHYKFSAIKDYAIELTEYYTYTVHVGSTDISSKDEANKFYGSLFTKDMGADNNGKITTSLTPDELKKFINQNTLINYNNNHYKFSEIKDYLINLNEYIKVDMDQNVPVSFDNEIIYNNDTYLQKDSTVKLTADQDWILQHKINGSSPETEKFETIDDLTFIFSNYFKIFSHWNSNPHFFDFWGNNNYYKLACSKFNINLESNEKVHLLDNRSQSNSYLWKDLRINNNELFSYKIPLNFETENNGYIKSVSVTDSNNTSLTVCFSDDTTYNNITGYNLLNKDSQYQNNAHLNIMVPKGFKSSDNFEFKVHVEVIPPTTTTCIKKYSFQTKKWTEESIESKINADGTITAPAILKDENNYMTHILMACDKIDNLQPTPYNLIEIFNLSSIKSMSVPYNQNKHTFYYLPIDTKDADIKPFEILGTKTNKDGVYSLSVKGNNAVRINAFKIMSDLTLMYERYFDDDFKNGENTIMFQRQKYNAEVPSKNNFTFLAEEAGYGKLDFVVVRGIHKYLQNSSSSEINSPSSVLNDLQDNSSNPLNLLKEVSNIIDSQIYFYIDRKSPEIKKISEDGKEISGNLPWSNSDITFKVNIDDRNELEKGKYSSELYNTFNNIASKTSKIQIGNYTFTINDGVITKSIVGSPAAATADGNITTVKDGKSADYDISECNIDAQYAENEDGTETVTFKVTTANDSINYLRKDNVPIIVTDACDNSSQSSVNIWIDKSAPYLKTFSINTNELSGVSKNVVATGKNIRFNYEASDIDDNGNEGSGISSVIAEYISDKTYQSVLKDNQNMFEWDKFQNTKGKIRITVTDNAGNITVYFYQNGTFTDKADLTTADTVIFDNTRPQTAITNKDELDGKWFDSYPAINFSIKDNNISSGISDLIIKVNGVDVSAKFTSTKDNETFTLSPESYSSILTDEKSSGYSADGNIRISAYARDTAGNTDEERSISFHVDDQNPYEPKTFRAEDEKVQIRNFGIFYNDGFKIKVDIEDNKVHSSGISKAVLELDGKEYLWETQNRENSSSMTAEFNIDQIPVISKAPSITVYDKVGHKSEKIQLVSATAASNPGINAQPYITIEKNPPVISVNSIKGDDHYIKNNNGLNEDWYSSDVNISFTVSDPDSGISKALITRNNNEQLKNADYTGESKAVNDYSDSVSTPADIDGHFTFDFSASDNASNNAVENIITVYKDIKAPEITGFSFDSSNDDSIYDLIPVPYFYFFGQSSSVTVHAKDDGASSGIKTISLKFEGINAPDIMTGQAQRDENGNFICTFEIPEGFKGVISAKATDNVNNTPDEWKSPKAYISEESQRHSQTSSLSVKLPETSFTDRNGLPLYNTDIDATLTAEDSFSGLNTITVQSPDFNENVVIPYSENLQDVSGWQTQAADINIINRLSKTVRMVSNLNGNKITMDAQDNSGNKFTTVSKEFSIDKTNPEINVNFDNNSPDSTYNDMYKAPRHATVQIKERNFDPSKVNISPSYPHGDWKLVSGQEGTDSAVYQTVLSFDSDGTYEFTVDCKDMCENTAQQYKSPKFTVDLTSPELKVTYDRNDTKNGNYYKNSITATIEVTELNFDPSRINITGTKDGNADNFPVKNGKYEGKDLVWNNKGKNTWVTTVSLNEDGYYELKVSGTDKAGNTAKSYSDNFFIDKIGPSVEFSGVTDSQAYNGDVLPVVEITDQNLDFDTVKLKLEGSKQGVISDIKGNAQKGTGKYTFSFDNFPDLQEYDDIYTITAEATDFAGNVRSSSVKFSVNRFGSTFEPDEQTALLENKYICEPQDIVIHEINVDPHPDDFVPIVTLSKDGTGITLKQGKDYSLEPVKDSSTGWTMYEYVIKSENFTDDAVYEISIYSEDEAENKNNGTSIITFGIDKTQPSVNFINVENNGTYKTDSKEIITLVEDNMGVDSVEVYINGSPLDKADYLFDAQTCECRFNVPGSNSSQSIEVIPVDLAGNKADAENSKVENVLVSTNIARIMLHKTWFKIASAAAVVAGGASAFIIIRRKKKLSD